MITWDSTSSTMEQSTEGITIALSPVQLAAVLVDESLSTTETMLNSVWGGVRVLGGVVELLGAGVLCAVPEPTFTTKAGCIFVGLHASDTLVAGLRQASTGQLGPSVTERGTTAIAERLGVDQQTASTIGLTVDVAVSVTGTALAGAVRVASVRAGRLHLALHEAPAGSRVGGHTILKHVAQSEAQMRARLAASPPRILQISSFTNLGIAESAISKALRANSLRINTWARTAATGAVLRIEFQLGSVVGQGVARSSTTLRTLRGVRIILKQESFNGMPYYVLTAFPI